MIYKIVGHGKMWSICLILDGRITCRHNIVCKKFLVIRVDLSIDFFSFSQDVLKWLKSKSCYRYESNRSGPNVAATDDLKSL